MSKIFALCIDLSMCCFCVILELTFGVLMGEIIYNNDIFDHCKNSGSPGAVLSVVIISPFSIPPSPQTHTLTHTHTPHPSISVISICSALRSKLKPSQEEGAKKNWQPLYKCIHSQLITIIINKPYHHSRIRRMSAERGRDAEETSEKVVVK